MVGSVGVGELFLASPLLAVVVGVEQPRRVHDNARRPEPIGTLSEDLGKERRPGQIECAFLRVRLQPSGQPVEELAEQGVPRC